ncbi:HDIG domain-containing protein [Flexibacter flexilis DSM 6793]|uniref:HDIG domain-containing protein n=1 Tax=Flexibacter flexilis DSM 6793 TaxID=927664 RepID=A0A1I1KLD9_9BACT|nr:HD domain-containing protein [Flexibacter flexilis]SFC58943.1 HDIG domain-containing protein [Flexibacter flexilis DSM 6793]
MSIYKTALDEHIIFKQIAECADRLGVQAFVIGGFVRDLILGRPCKDIDIVCLGSGIALAEALAEALPDRPNVTVFKNFGTAMLRSGEWEVEFVGARRESYRSDSRKPIVENGTLEDDQNRRDFTINALAIGLNAKNYGQLLDPFGGVEDLRKKIIRTPLDPDITFSDDPLRMMRAIRFATQLGFDIEAETFSALARNKERLEIVSKERITDELNKIILAKKPSYGFKLLLHSELLQLIFPEMVELLGAANLEGKTHKDNFYHTLEVLENVAAVSDDLWLRWAAILHDIAKPATKRFDQKLGWTFHGHEDKGARMTPAIFARMRLPMNEKMKFVQKLVRLHLRPIALVKDTVTDSAIRRLIVEAGEALDGLMILCRADITTKNPNKAKRYLENFDKVERRMNEVEEFDKLRNFRPAVSGEEIMTTFGLTPSPMVGVIKESIKEAILEGVIPNEHAEVFAFMLEVGAKNGLKPIH